MRILMLTGNLPQSSELATMHTTLPVLRYLAREHQVSLLSQVHQPLTATFQSELRSMCERVRLVPQHDAPWQSVAALVTSIASGSAYALQRQRTARMHDAVQQIVQNEQIDAIHLDHIGMAQFVPAYWQRPIILDERRSLWREVSSKARACHDPARSWVLQRDARLLRALEAKVCRRATVTLAGSEMERAALEQALGAPWRIHIVPESVDLSAFEPLWQRRSSEPGRMITLAPNGDAATQQALEQFLTTIYPAVRRLNPLTTLDVQTQAILPWSVKQQPGCSVYSLNTAYAPLHEQSATLWRAASVYLAPQLPNQQAQRGILGALAAGIPVVAHPSACDGLAVLEGEHLLMAQTPEDFVACIEWLGREVSHMHKLVMRGRRLIQDRYDTSVALAGLSAAYEHVAHAVNDDTIGTGIAGIKGIYGGSRCVYCS